MTARALATLVLACTLTGCSLTGGQMRPDASSYSTYVRAVPHVVQKGNGAQWVQFTPHTLGALYSAMALGPDGIAPSVLYMVSDLSGDQTGRQRLVRRRER